MTETPEPLEIFWDAVLSRQSELIRAAIGSLDTAGRRRVLAHLQRMAKEEGWHPEQRASAEAALRAWKES